MTEDILSLDFDKDEEIEQIRKMLAARNNIMAEIGIENLILKIKDIINNSEKVKFRSEFATQIDTQVPVFIMAFKEETYKEVLNGKETDEVRIPKADEYEQRAIDVISEEVIGKVSEIFEEYLKDNKEELEDKLQDVGIDVQSLLLSNIFGILVGKPEDNNIQLRIII